MRNGVKILGQISVNDIFIACTKQLIHFPDSIMRAPLRSVTIGTRFQIRLEDRLNQQFSGALNHSVPNSENSEWALAAPGLGDHHHPCPTRLCPAPPPRLPAVLSTTFGDATSTSPGTPPLTEHSPWTCRAH